MQPRCLYCGEPLSFFKRLKGGTDFCSEGHRRKYQEEYQSLALDRLQQAKALSDKPRLPLSLPMEPALLAERVAPMMAPAPVPPMPPPPPPVLDEPPVPRYGDGPPPAPLADWVFEWPETAAGALELAGLECRPIASSEHVHLPPPLRLPGETAWSWGAVGLELPGAPVPEPVCRDLAAEPFSWEGYATAFPVSVPRFQATAAFSCRPAEEIVAGEASAVPLEFTGWEPPPAPVLATGATHLALEGFTAAFPVSVPRIPSPAVVLPTNPPPSSGQIVVSAPVSGPAAKMSVSGALAFAGRPVWKKSITLHPDSLPTGPAADPFEVVPPPMSGLQALRYELAVYEVPANLQAPQVGWHSSPDQRLPRRQAALAAEVLPDGGLLQLDSAPAWGTRASAVAAEPVDFNPGAGLRLRHRLEPASAGSRYEREIAALDDEIGPPWKTDPRTLKARNVAARLRRREARAEAVEAVEIQSGMDPNLRTVISGGLRMAEAISLGAPRPASPAARFFDRLVIPHALPFHAGAPAPGTFGPAAEMRAPGMPEAYPVTVPAAAVSYGGVPHSMPVAMPVYYAAPAPANLFNAIPMGFGTQGGGGSLGGGYLASSPSFHSEPQGIPSRPVMPGWGAPSGPLYAPVESGYVDWSAPAAPEMPAPSMPGQPVVYQAYSTPPAPPMPGPTVPPPAPGGASGMPAGARPERPAFLRPAPPPKPAPRRYEAQPGKMAPAVPLLTPTDGETRSMLPFIEATGLPLQQPQMSLVPLRPRIEWGAPQRGSRIFIPRPPKAAEGEAPVPDKDSSEDPNKLFSKLSARFKKVIPS